MDLVRHHPLLVALTASVCAAAVAHLPESPPAPAHESTAQLDVAEEEIADAPSTPPAPECPGLTAAEPAWLPLSAGDDVVSMSRMIPVPENLARRTAFWERVWGSLSEQHTLIVDKRAPWLVWAEADCTALPDASTDGACGGLIAQALRTAKARLRTDDVDALVLSAYPTKAERDSAAMHLIGVRGRSEPLRRAMRRARNELPTVEAIFAAHGVPPALARTAIVESLWRPDAVSHAGATGTFQFTETTGKVYLHIDEYVDERRDTARAAVAAARYLKSLHGSFKSWPLALTAYNTGPGRLRKVMRAHNSRDLAVLADRGDYAGFGFDGQNYVAQIAAVTAVTADEPLTARLADAKTLALQVTQPRSLYGAAQCLHVEPAALARANPALGDAVRGGEAPLPVGYVLRVPSDVDTTAALVSADLTSDAPTL